MPRAETMTLYKARKEALASTHMGHVEKEFDLLTDEIGEDGIRTIRLKPKDLTEIQKMQVELVDKLMEKMGETGNMLREILLDTVKDYHATAIKRMYQKVVLGEAPVRRGKGYYYISIGDGRKKGADILRIRE